MASCAQPLNIERSMRPGTVVDAKCLVTTFDFSCSVNAKGRAVDRVGTPRNFFLYLISRTQEFRLVVCSFEPLARNGHTAGVVRKTVRQSSGVFNGSAPWFPVPPLGFITTEIISLSAIRAQGASHASGPLHWIQESLRRACNLLSCVILATWRPAVRLLPHREIEETCLLHPLRLAQYFLVRLIKNAPEDDLVQSTSDRSKIRRCFG